MENQDKIYKQFSEASKKAETKDFPAMEKVWARVEEKLDKKEDRKTAAIWKRIGIAASLLLLVSLGYHFFPEEKETTPPKNSIVFEEKNTPESPAATTGEAEKNANENKAQAEKEGSAVSYSMEERVSNNVDEAMPTETLASAEAAVSEPEPEILKAQAAETMATEAKINSAASQKTITGIISDSQGLPLPGANVIVKGTSRGTYTDFDGRYSIQANPGEKLEFGYVGMKTAAVPVENSNRVDIALQESSQALSEVVVTTGYGRKKRKERKNSTASIGTAVSPKLSTGYIQSDLRSFGNAGRNSSIVESRKEKVYGTSIDESLPKLSESKKAVMRGFASLTDSNEPLYVVDGIPVSQKDFASLDPNDIKTVSVLEEAAAASIYGYRGSNGVIVVNTKKGIQKKLSKRQIRKRLRTLKKKQSAANAEKEVQPQEKSSQEDYESFVENPFKSPKTEPLSTFSIDVDNASYTNVRRFINNGQAVPKDAVRVEEIINFFKYRYPQPKGSHPFSINTEYSTSPWNPKHKLLRIGLQGKIIPNEKLPASNLVFLIDVSGSMNEQNKLPLLKESMKILTGQLRKEDKVSIVVYAGAAGLVLPPTSGSDKSAIIEALEKLSAGGSTAGGAGIELAYKTAQENFIKNGNNRVILATDGDFNVGSASNADMEALIEEKRKSGIFLTCLGYGMDNYKDSKMQLLADKGNGNHAYIDNIQEASRFLGKEFKGSMFAIAKDVKIQIEFNPKHVQSYRLIGYENRKLRPEDFTDDAIDAGELGSGHTVTALYEIIPAGAESEFYKKMPHLKYAKAENNQTAYSDELATIKFRYKKPDGTESIEITETVQNISLPLENASKDFKFSAAAAWFGLKLRDSKLIRNKSSEAIKELAKEGLENDDDGYKAEFIRLVESAK
ncbi:MAG TPA: von Willebrand factor type A domain-containing protein [Flavobacterium sp.]|nr:von Willebrand factor type A domain-containing protein [Flavobacterium sp.]